ncbi:MAG: hypothetical protein ABIS92_01305, partial [Polyangia bacterium]
ARQNLGKSLAKIAGSLTLTLSHYRGRGQTLGCAKGPWVSPGATVSSLTTTVSVYALALSRKM